MNGSAVVRVASSLLCLGALWGGLSLAEPRVLMVVPPKAPDQAGRAVALELKLGHSPDVSLVTRGPQLEILRGLGLAPDAAVDDALALRLGRLSGADAVVTTGAHGFQLCQVEAARCAAAPAPANAPGADLDAQATAILVAVGADPVPAHDGAWPDETAHPRALAAYARCRSAVSLALEQTAVKGKGRAPKNLGADCQAALAADPDFLPAQSALAAAKALGDDASAEATLRALLIKLPTDPIAPIALVHLWRGRADRDQAAFELLDVAEQHALRSIDLRRQRAELYLASDMIPNAYAAFVSALQLAPRSPYLHWRVSHALHLKGNDAEALEHAQTASKLAGEDHPFYASEYAGRLLDLKRYAQAQAILEPLRKKDPTWGRVALRLGYALHMQGRSAEALPHLALAARARPRYAREDDDRNLAHLDLARAHAKLGHADQAIAELRLLQKAGALDAASVQDADFDAVRARPAFVQLTQAHPR